MTGTPHQVLEKFVARGHRTQLAVDDILGGDKARRRRAVAGVLERLILAFPAAFAAEGAPKTPLKAGIAEDVVAAVRDVAPDLLREAVCLYMRGPSYLVALADGAPRLDLNGRPVGRVAPSEAQRAEVSLRRCDEPTLERALQLIAAGAADPATIARAALDDVAAVRAARKRTSS